MSSRVLAALETARQGYPALARLLVEATPMGEARHNEFREEVM
jgi:hypothetical protein